MAPSLYLIAPQDADSAGFLPTLRAVLAATPISALLLRRGDRNEAAYGAFATAVAGVAQPEGCAVLIEGEPALAKRLGVDGLHVEGSVAAVKAAIAALKPALIVGAGGMDTRHDAMTLGELNLDYIMFGPFSGVTAPEIRDLAGWWAETMEIPSVLSDPEANAAAADAAGCEFLALGDSVWRSADPARTLSEIATVLETQA